MIARVDMNGGNESAGAGRQGRLLAGSYCAGSTTRVARASLVTTGTAFWAWSVMAEVRASKRKLRRPKIEERLKLMNVGMLSLLMRTGRADLW